MRPSSVGYQIRSDNPMAHAARLDRPDLAGAEVPFGALDQPKRDKNDQDHRDY